VPEIEGSGCAALQPLPEIRGVLIIVGVGRTREWRQISGHFGGYRAARAGEKNGEHQQPEGPDLHGMAIWRLIERTRSA
jgi:hypothetical protein